MFMLIIYRLCLHNHLGLLYVKTFQHSVDVRINYIRFRAYLRYVGRNEYTLSQLFPGHPWKGVAPISLPKHGLLKFNFPHNRLQLIEFWGEKYKI